MTFDLEKGSNKLLILLLLADLVFIIIHGLYRMNLVSNSLFSIERDFGYAEVYQYIKECLMQFPYIALYCIYIIAEIFYYLYIIL